jgi:hypothetical protein
MSTITNGAMTLAQWANMANDPLIYQFTKSLLKVSNPLNDIPLVTKSTLKMNGSRLVTAPTVNWRSINASTTATSVNFTPYQESAYILSNTLDVDIKLLQDQNWITDPRAARLMAYAEGVAFDFADKFINNNHVSGNLDAVVGLRARLDQATLYGNNTACLIDGGGVDLSDSGISAANTAKFNALVRRMLDEIGSPDGSGVVIYMNRELRRRWEQGLRLSGSGSGFDTTRDAYDRRIAVFDNAQIRPVGVKADQSTEIITSTETSAGANGSSTFTSMYAVRYGEDAFVGWQMAPLAVQDLAQIASEPTTYRLFVDWACGLWQESTRAVSRVYDIKVA